MTESRIALFTFTEVGEILGSNSEGDPGVLPASDIFGISTDSRNVEPGDLFIALKGQKFDGHNFLQTAFERGAIAAVISRDKYQIIPKGNYIVVRDTLRALGDLAAAYRQKMPAKIVGVTGSNGKTTVKNIVYEILVSQGPALKSLGNFNNFIGLPLSIFKLRTEHQNAVFELGMSAKGEIARLAEISRPDVGIITNVGPVHLEFLKTIERVAEAKLEIVDRLSDSGVLVINGDDEMLSGKLDKRSVKILSFGLGTANDIRPTALDFNTDQIPRFRIGDIKFALSLPGMHNVYNALAAYAAAKALGIPEDRAAEAISSYKAQDMRSEVIHKNGVTLLVDCYNANPASTKIALETLSKMRSAGHRIAVLADMLELGKMAQAYHQEIGKTARRLGIKYLLAYGPLSKFTVESFGDGGLYFESREALLERLLEIISEGDIILFKGSRGMVLEKVVDAVKDNL